MSGSPLENRLPELSEEDQKFLHQVVRFQDHALTVEEMREFEAALLHNPDRMRQFTEWQVQSYAIHGLLRREAFQNDSSESSLFADSEVPDQRRLRKYSLAAITVAGLLIAGMFLFRSLPTGTGENVESIATVEQERTESPAESVGDSALEQSDVVVAGMFRAKFFGEYNPHLQSQLQLHRDYILTTGLVELAFPSGASAVVDAPAVFRIVNNDCLGLETGQCSVHAPPGAEGFRVDTPLTEVVDRGTRFHVTATEGMETEVQVLEGVADIYWKSFAEQGASDNASLASFPLEFSQQFRLEQADARRFSGTEQVQAQDVRYLPERYRHRLPDRVISYEATRNSKGAAESLLSVSLVRDGQQSTIPAEQMILADLIYFKSHPTTRKFGFLAGTGELPERRSSLLSSFELNSGVVNPGGQKRPLEVDPVMNAVEDSQQPNTPGFAIRFHEPVINGPGPDVVFFELQAMPNPPEGDPFHVSPVHFRPGLRSITVKKYDLTLFSAETLRLAPFELYQFDSPIGSLDELENRTVDRTRMHLGFRCLAVGIDLSELGYEVGEQVNELFFQDAHDDVRFVDPVFIAGLRPTTHSDLKSERQVQR